MTCSWKLTKFLYFVGSKWLLGSKEKDTVSKQNSEIPTEKNANGSVQAPVQNLSPLQNNQTPRVASGNSNPAFHAPKLLSSRSTFTLRQFLPLPFLPVPPSSSQFLPVPPLRTPAWTERKRWPSQRDRKCNSSTSPRSRRGAAGGWGGEAR